MDASFLFLYSRGNFIDQPFCSEAQALQQHDFAYILLAELFFRNELNTLPVIRFSEFLGEFRQSRIIAVVDFNSFLRA